MATLITKPHNVESTDWCSEYFLYDRLSCKPIMTIISDCLLSEIDFDWYFDHLIYCLSCKEEENSQSITSFQNQRYVLKLPHDQSTIRNGKYNTFTMMSTKEQQQILSSEKLDSVICPKMLISLSANWQNISALWRISCCSRCLTEDMQSIISWKLGCRI